MNKNARSKIPLKTKAPFKWVFVDIIPSTAPKSLTSDTTFSKYLLIVDAYSKITNHYGMENITTEEVMDKLDMFQSRFRKIDQFGWWDLERISADAGWEDVELRIYPDPFCTSCQISSMNKKSRSKIPLKPKVPFKWVLWI